MNQCLLTKESLSKKIPASSINKSESDWQFKAVIFVNFLLFVFLQIHMQVLFKNCFGRNFHLHEEDLVHEQEY